MRTAPAQYAFQEQQRPWIGLTENVEDLDVTLSAPSPVLLRHLFNRYMNASARMDACHSHLGCAPEGQSQLAEFLHVELAVPYFPFRQTTPNTGRRVVDADGRPIRSAVELIDDVETLTQRQSMRLV